MTVKRWRKFHLVMLFALGSVIEWTGLQLREWAGDKLKESWKEPSK